MLNQAQGMGSALIKLCGNVPLIESRALKSDEYNLD